MSTIRNVLLVVVVAVLVTATQQQQQFLGQQGYNGGGAVPPYRPVSFCNRLVADTNTESDVLVHQTPHGYDSAAATRRRASPMPTPPEKVLRQRSSVQMSLHATHDLCTQNTPTHRRKHTHRMVLCAKIMREFLCMVRAATNQPILCTHKHSLES